MAVEYIPASVGAVMSHPPLVLREKLQSATGDMIVTRCTEAIADHKIGRPQSWVAHAQRRHRMQVDQQRNAPRLAQIVQRAG